MRLDHFNGTGRHRDGSRRRDLFDRNHSRVLASRVQGSRLVPRCRRLAVSRRLFPLPPPRVAVSRLRGPIHVTTMNSIHDIGSSPHCLSLHVYKSVCRSVEGGRAPLVLAWALQRGVAVIPKSTRAARIRENAGVFGWELGAADMGAIARLGEEHRARYVPGNPKWRAAPPATRPPWPRDS